MLWQEEAEPAPPLPSPGNQGPEAPLITARSLRQLLLTLAPFPALCQVPGELPALPAVKLTLFHHASDLGSPISPPAGDQSPLTHHRRVLLCGYTGLLPSPAHNWLTSKPLLIQAFCSRLSVYLHSSVHLCQHLLKCELVRWVSFHSLFCALHVHKHAQWRAGPYS